MNAKIGWLGWGLFVGMFGIAVHLYSQDAEEEPKPQTTLNDETEVAILGEKANALDAQLGRLVSTHKESTPLAFSADECLLACEEYLVRAELAEMQGQGQEQIGDLEQAVAFAEDAVEIQLKRQESGAVGELMKAINLRADAKLALLRAKKQQPMQ